MLHCLLEMPCLTASLDLSQKEHLTQRSQSDTSSIPQGAALESFTNRSYRPLFRFLLRSESGKGDTIDRYSMQC